MSERASPLGIPVIDGAVDGDGGWVGRVQVLIPGAACIECPWGSEHYRRLAVKAPCNPAGAQVAHPPTHPHC